MKDDNRTDSTLTTAPRLDKWLWAARFFKTRSLAADAIAGGKVDVSGERAKRSRPVRVGDLVRVRSGQFEHHVVVKKLSQSRGSATIAATLFDETPASLAARQTLAAQLRALATSGLESGRPSKKERRDHTRFLDRQGRDED